MKHGPCKDCKKRELHCHSTCKEYNDWKKKYVAEATKAAKLRYVERDANRRSYEARRRFKRYK